MKVLERPSLKSLNTFGVEASAGLLLTIETEEDFLSLPAFDPRRDFVLGGGSNVLFVSDVPGTVFLNRITGKDIISEHDGYAQLEVGAGENWHQLVRWSLDQGLWGLENLSLIPGPGGCGPDTKHWRLWRGTFVRIGTGNGLGLAKFQLGDFQPGGMSICLPRQLFQVRGN